MTSRASIDYAWDADFYARALAKAPIAHAALDLLIEALGSPRLRPQARPYLDSFASRLCWCCDNGREISDATADRVFDAVMKALGAEGQP